MGTPLPTDLQFEAFAEHVAWAHSWYKHLDLVHGAEVVVFLDPRAGGGFDPHRPGLHPPRKEYVERFGHLAYMWRPGHLPDAKFHTDYEGEMPTLILPQEIMEQCGFRMFPFACDNGVLLYRFKNELNAMARGAVDHPCKDLLVTFLQAEEAKDHMAASLRKRFPDRDEYDRESSRLFHRCSIEIARQGYGESRALYRQSRRWSQWSARSDVDATGTLSDWQEDHIRADREARAALCRLFDHEEGKIRRALDKLREHLVAAGLCVAKS